VAEAEAERERATAFGPGADRALAAWVDAHLDEILQDLVRMLRIPSVKAEPTADAPFGRGVKAALDAFLAPARAEGFAVETLPGVAGHIEWGPPGAPLVGVLAHLDVVPAGAGWNRDPFGAERDGDRIYARGAMDDKGPAVAAYWALKAARAVYGEGHRRVRLIVGGDEESDFECLHRYFAVHEMPDLGFTPDAGFPIVTAEKGIVTFVLSAPLAAAAGAGAVGPRLRALQAGTRANVVAAEAHAELELGVDAATRDRVANALLQAPGPDGTTLEVGTLADGALAVAAHGRAAHASLPEQGANAAARLMLALAAVDAWSPADRAVFAHLGRSGADLDGAALGVASSDAESGPLTCNLGTVALVGGRVRAEYNLRYPVSERLEALLARARAAAAPSGVEVEAGGGHPPLRAESGWEIVRTLERVFEAETGRPATHLAIGGGTYARELRQGVAFGPQWPEDEELAHAPDEYISIERLRRMVAIYARAIAVLAGSAPLP
jgi:succinyl-diaminopimelate desuccinylase